MKVIFSDLFIKDYRTLFIVSVVLIVAIIILTLFFVIREIKNATK